MAWSTPKTNWKLYSKFNIEDFNRIKNNIAYLHEIAVATLGGFDIEGLLKVFKRVAHGEQLLLIGIVFDNSHGDLLFSYCISRKSISYRRAKGKKNPPRRRIFPIFYRQRCKLPHKNKKSTHPCVVPFWSLSAR